MSGRDMVFAHVDDLVARFGFPANPRVEQGYLVWEYSTDEPLANQPDRLFVRIARNHVVSVSALNIPEANSSR